MSSFDDPQATWDAPPPASAWASSSFPRLNALLADCLLRRRLILSRHVVPASPEPPVVVGGLADLPPPSQETSP